MKRMNLILAAAFAVLFTFSFTTQQVMAQPGGQASAVGVVSIIPSKGPATTIDTQFDVTWDDFVEVNPDLRRANISDAAVENALFQVETEVGPENWIELRRDNVTLRYWVWVCHRVRICRWYCGWCCIPTYYTICWRSRVSYLQWDSGLVVDLDVVDNVDFEDSDGNILTVEADASSVSFVVP